MPNNANPVRKQQRVGTSGHFPNYHQPLEIVASYTAWVVHSHFLGSDHYMLGTWTAWVNQKWVVTSWSWSGYSVTSWDAPESRRKTIQWFAWPWTTPSKVMECLVGKQIIRGVYHLLTHISSLLNGSDKCMVYHYLLTHPFLNAFTECRRRISIAIQFERFASEPLHWTDMGYS